MNTANFLYCKCSINVKTSQVYCCFYIFFISVTFFDKVYPSHNNDQHAFFETSNYKYNFVMLSSCKIVPGGRLVNNSNIQSQINTISDSNLICFFHCCSSVLLYKYKYKYTNNYYIPSTFFSFSDEGWGGGLEAVGGLLLPLIPLQHSLYYCRRTTHS